MTEISGPLVTDLVRSLRSRRIWVILLLGFSSGLPYMLMASTLKIWLRREGVDIGTIGYFNLVMLPYTLNFLWAPILDRFTPLSLGRRRSWILIAQLGLIASLIALSATDPASSVRWVVYSSIIVAFFSATQDIGIDAYRRESFRDEEQGLAASVIVYGYRIGILTATGLGLWLVDPETLGLSFQQMFLLMAGCVLVGVATILLSPEPETEHPPPSNFEQAVVSPLLEFVQRDGAILILLFVLCFKVGDHFAATLTPAFYVDLGYSNAQIAEASQGVGFFSTMIGLFLGGVMIYRIGILRSLLTFAFLQALTTASFIFLQWAEGSWWALAGIVALEDLSSGMGTAALVAFMSLLANKRYTAFQYALLSSLASLGRIVLSSFAGDLAKAVGYTSFFVIASAMAVPGILLLLAVWRHYQAATEVD